MQDASKQACILARAWGLPPRDPDCTYLSDQLGAKRLHYDLCLIGQGAPLCHRGYEGIRNFRSLNNSSPKDLN